MDFIESFMNTLAFALPAVLIAIIFHETAHGLVSYLLGDPTPKEDGRLSLNPMRHLDPFGTICLLFFHFGWAKPVRIDGSYYKHPRLGLFLVSLAGPVVNFIIAFLGIFFMGLIIKFNGYNIDNFNQFINYLYHLSYYIFVINVGLGVFNLIPIPPLDGSKMLASILPEKVLVNFLKYDQAFMLVLLLMLAIGILDGPLYFISDSLYSFYFNIISFIFRI